MLRYHDHVFPVRPGTEQLPLAELLERQHYRLAYWRVADEELNYRRFFDVGTLARRPRRGPGRVRRDAPRSCSTLLADGTIDGLRIDHPDGLADPGGYLARLREASGGAWVVVEKILEDAETLPGDWDTAGTTGYDALWRIQQTFVDPGGAAVLGALMHRLTGDASDEFADVVEQAKREIVDGPLYAEVYRLTSLAATSAATTCACATTRGARSRTASSSCSSRSTATARTSCRASRAPRVARGAPGRRGARARRACPERGATMDVVVDLLLGREVGSAGRTRGERRDELVVRFQQTCGAVTAKGVEDTAFYRWTQLVGLCEVGGEPARFALTPSDLAAWAARQQASPRGMTTLSTHDTKSGEDTRARLGVLSELPREWAASSASCARRASSRSARVDGRAEYLLWQTLAGTWTAAGPIAGTGWRST